MKIYAYMSESYKITDSCLLNPDSNPICYNNLNCAECSHFGLPEKDKVLIRFKTKRGGSGIRHVEPCQVASVLEKLYNQRLEASATLNGEKVGEVWNRELDYCPETKRNYRWRWFVDKCLQSAE